MELPGALFNPSSKNKKILHSNITFLCVFSNKKAAHIFQETNPPKKMLILSQKKAFPIFREMEVPKKSLYIS